MDAEESVKSLVSSFRGLQQPLRPASASISELLEARLVLFMHLLSRGVPTSALENAFHIGSEVD